MPLAKLEVPWQDKPGPDQVRRPELTQTESTITNCLISYCTHNVIKLISRKNGSELI